MAVAFFKIDEGIFYRGEKCGTLFLWQLVGAISIASWSIATTFMYFKVATVVGAVRLSPSEETIGGDIYFFGPKKLKGNIAEYARFFELTRLGTPKISLEEINTPSSSINGSI
jgi:ammonia channel protein AmtB